MRERPIIFSGAMVRAILAGTKTQTRRVMKLTERAARALANAEPPIQESPGYFRWPTNGDPGRVVDNWNGWSPYGVPGDRLWVRESFVEGHPSEGSEIRSDLPLRAWYRADPTLDIWIGEDGGERNVPWRSSTQMPRKYSRITLEITDVRIERVQCLTDADAKAEGFPVPGKQITNQRVTHMDGRVETSIVDGYFFDARTNFVAHWQAMHEKRAPWSSNPFVWALTFKRVNQ